MKRTRILYGVGTCVVALVLWFSFSRHQMIRHHTKSWQSAMQNYARGIPPPRLQQIFNHQKGNIMYWLDVAREHEADLLELGYLTNCEFRLTNQVLTSEFFHSFHPLIQQRVGTNSDQVWRCPVLTNKMGISPIFPLKDLATWEQTFRECASLYASNLPPAMPKSSNRGSADQINGETGPTSP